MGATLRAPIASSSQMLGSIGTVVNPDVEIEHDCVLEAGSEARPTQPPHQSLSMFLLATRKTLKPLARQTRLMLQIFSVLM